MYVSGDIWYPFTIVCTKFWICLDKHLQVKQDVFFMKQNNWTGIGKIACVSPVQSVTAGDNGDPEKDKGKNWSYCNYTYVQYGFITSEYKLTFLRI